MKKLPGMAFLLLLLMASCQNEDNNAQQAQAMEEKMHDVRMYHQAMDMADYATAITAAQSLLARDPSQTQYYDTLAMLYFQSGRYPQAAQVANHMLQQDPKSQKYMEVMARSLEAGGKTEEAAMFFQRLREQTGDPNYDYQMATMYFKANQMDKSEAFANKIFSAQKLDTSTVKLFNSSGQMQVVPLKAATYNLLGSLRYRQRKPDEARQYFEKAVQTDTAFMLAKENLNNLGKK